MKELRKVFGSFTRNEWIGTILFALTLVITQITTGSTLIAFTASMLGVIYVTLVRKGSRLCYIFGAIQILIYIFIAFNSKIYGDVMLNSFNLVMQPIGWYMWSKRTHDDGIVEPKSLKRTTLITILIVWVGAIIVYGNFLEILGGNTPQVDAITTISSITAMLLSISAYRTQWLFWTICNGTSVFMWSLAFLRGDKSAIPMALMFTAYLINGLVGWRQWDNRK